MLRYSASMLLMLPLLLSGCLSLFTREIVELPLWVTSPPQNTEKTLFGVGEGPTLARAKEAGLNDIAGNLGTEISSVVDRFVLQNGDRVKDVAREVLSARTDKIKLTHAKMLKSAKYENSTYVLMSVSREGLVQESRAQLAELDLLLRQKLKRLASLSQLQQFIRVKKLAPKVERSLGVVATLRVLDSRFDGGPYLERYSGYREKGDDVLRGMHFSIRPTREMRRIGEHLVALLGQAEIKSRLEIGARSASSVIEITGRITKDVAFGSKFSRLTAVLEVKDDRGNSIARREYKATGKSSNDHRSATRDAIEKVLKQWGRLSILDVLGLDI